MSEYIRTYWRRDLHDAAPLLLFFLIYMPLFMLLEKGGSRDYTVMHAAVDDVIPFCEYFVIPYLLWFPFMLVGVVGIFFLDRECYRKSSEMLIAGMSIFLIISGLFPTEQHLRPVFFIRDNFCTELVRILYRTDTPTNVFPSIHVYNTLCVWYAVSESRSRILQNPAVKGIVWAMSVSIILSTMFLKQHSFIDVIGAFLMAECLCQVFQSDRSRAAGKAREESHL